MLPFVRDGDIVTIAPLQHSVLHLSTIAHSVLPLADLSAVRPCRIGEVVALICPANQRLLVHRIIGRRGSSFLIQGDNTQGSVADAVCASDIIGRVVRIERARKHVWLGLGPERYAIAMLSRAGLLLPILARASMLVRFWRNRRDEGS